MNKKIVEGLAGILITGSMLCTGCTRTINQEVQMGIIQTIRIPEPNKYSDDDVVPETSVAQGDYYFQKAQRLHYKGYKVELDRMNMLYFLGKSVQSYKEAEKDIDDKDGIEIRISAVRIFQMRTFMEYR